MRDVFAGGRVLPVMTVRDASEAEDTAHALLAGGIGMAEVALRSAAAIDAISRLAGIEGFTVGAGTVLEPDQIRTVRDAGARFAVAPGLDREVAEAALDAGLPFFPGIATATEVQSALRLGLHGVKVFPAATLGGPRFLELLAGPFPTLDVLPSGGIGLDTFASYLSVPSVVAVSGSWMVPSGAGARDVERLARQTMEAAR